MRHSSILSACVLLFLVGCGGDDPIQPNNPTGNSDIVWQAMFGAADDWSAVHYLSVGSDNDVVFGGMENVDQRVIGLRPNGGVGWNLSSPCYVYGCRVFPAIFDSATEVAFIVGLNRNSRSALLAGYDLSGTLVLQQSFTYPGYDVWFSDLVFVSGTDAQSRFLLAGGARAHGVRYPYFVDVTLSRSGQVLAKHQKVLTDHPRSAIWWLTWNEQLTAPRYFATAPQFDSADELVRADVYGLNDTLGVAWAKNVMPPGAGWAVAEELRYLDGTVYVVGENSIKKNDWWYTSGTVASIAEVGTVNWKKSVIVSDKSDGYYACTIDGGALYAAGEYSRVVQRSTTHSFGYGLLTKVNLPDGDIVFHRSFGSAGYESRLWAIDVKDTRAFCGGFTRRFLKDYWYQGWVLEIDLAGTPTTVVNETTIPDGPSEYLLPLRPSRGGPPCQ